jgi:hypothetical protein
MGYDLRSTLLKKERENLEGIQGDDHSAALLKRG